MDRFRSPTSRMMMMRIVGHVIISQKTGIIITSFSYVSSCSTFCLSATIRIGKRLYDSKHSTKILKISKYFTKIKQRRESLCRWN